MANRTLNDVGQRTAKPNPTRAAVGKAADGSTVRLRMIVTNPVPGVGYAVQCGRDEIEQVQVATDKDLAFAVAVTLRASKDGAPDTRGPHVQGPLGGRFVYITSGKRAGQAGSPWDRRAKIPLSGVPEIAANTGGATITLEARIEGRMRDGGPMCASVKLTGGGWRRLKG